MKCLLEQNLPREVAVSCALRWEPSASVWRRCTIDNDTRVLRSRFWSLKVSTSAFEARENGFLSESDRIVFGRDRLLGEAKREVLKLAADGYRPPIMGKNVYVTGRDGLATLKVAIFGMRGGNYASLTPIPDLLFGTAE